MRLALVSCLLATAGCIGPADLWRPSGGEPTGWSALVEPAMAPDHSGMGETYPVLLVHMHHLASQRQRERWGDVVCLTLAGERADLASSPAMEDACAIAPADPATGRLFLERATFDERRPSAVAIFTGGCSGGLFFLDAKEPGFVVPTAEHEFTVLLLPNGTFTVDGRWVEPGTTLKISYYLHEGDAKDEEFVRVAFEAPGAWLVDRVGTATDGEIGPDVPSRPLEGTGLVTNVSLTPATLGDPVRAAIAATPGTVTGIRAMRAVHDGVRLTEFTLSVETSVGDVTWYGAGRTGDVMRLLGAEDFAASGASLDLVAIDALLLLSWETMRAGVAGTTTDARLAPRVAWSAVGPVVVSAPAWLAPACAVGCVMVAREGAWEQAVAPQRQEGEAAMTLHVLAYASGAPGEVWWHVPPANMQLRA